MQRIIPKIRQIIIAAVLMALSATASASDYAFAMASNDAVYAASGAGINESPGRSGSSSNGNLGELGSRYLVSGDEAGSAPEAHGDDRDSSASSPPTVTGGSGPTGDRRATHRWQSLVPGAIK